MKEILTEKEKEASIAVWYKENVNLFKPDEKINPEKFVRPFKDISEYLQNGDYVLPYKKGVVETTKKISNSAFPAFRVSLMIEDEEIREELIRRAGIEDDLKEEGNYVVFENIFFDNPRWGESSGFNALILHEDENGHEEIGNFIQTSVYLSYAENIAFHNKVMEIVPESAPIVQVSLNKLLDTIEKGKEKEEMQQRQNRHYDLSRYAR